ncbi:hypothetical protein Q428_02365 [Fervidicella metallireducens AeB]|uniref:ATP-grasp domain-containing protein n=1 Tax=Fervidicella metallireducens AeB TaxID=1403537 RepID=A0A017RXK2_9CLOT|nr:YheC/YheD family protein [Fervidicella metallireducens]EYE89493.1 hypothetical protein Q428_02365 [Fervidicella metallireducens AeB]
MISLICRIKEKSPFENSSGNTVYISPDLAKEISFKNNTKTKLICGGREIDVTVIVCAECPYSQRILCMNRDLLDTLLIPDDIEVEVIFHTSVIKLGPFIGILADKNLLEGYIDGNEFKEKFEIYSDTAKSIGAFAYIFKIKDLDLNKKQVKGWVVEYDDDSNAYLTRKTLPLPDVIYNRSVVSPFSSMNKKLKLLEKLNNSTIIMNRYTRINKLKVAKILSQNKITKKYIPKTFKFKGINDIEKMLQRFDAAYLKPVNGSFGSRVIKVIKDEKYGYAAFYNKDRENIKITGDLESVMSKLKDIMGKRTYIIQQGILLADYHGRPFDMRFVMQKNSKGSWDISWSRSRVASQNNAVTNVAAGGTSISTLKVIREASKDKMDITIEKIKEACIDICNILDKNLKLCDLGFDVGLDKDLNVYLIEVNFRELCRQSNISGEWEGISRCYKQPIYYLKSLYQQEMAKKYSPQN